MRLLLGPKSQILVTKINAGISQLIALNDSIEFDYDDDDDALIVNNAPIVATDDNDEEDVIEVVQNPNLYGFKQYGLKSGAIYLIQWRGSDEYGNPHPNT